MASAAEFLARRTSGANVVALPAPSETRTDDADFDAALNAARIDGQAARTDDAKAIAQRNERSMREAVGGMSVIIDQHGEGRLVIGSEAILLESQRALDHVGAAVYERTGKVLSADKLRTELSVLRAKAAQTNIRTPVYKRVASYEGSIVIDMGDGRGVYVSNGRIEVREHAGPLFKRGPGYGTLPEPKRYDSTAAAFATLSVVFSKMGIPENRHLLLAVALANALRPSVPYVIALLIGGAGSGKTTTAGNLAAFIDPTTSGELPNVPLNAQDVAAVAQEHHTLGVDNVSKITPSESDLLCMVVNGSEFVVREFHTRKETTRLYAHCQFFITAITNPATRGDLLDRVLPITLEPHGNYKGEDEIRQWFAKVQPAAFGAIVQLLAAGLARLPEVRKQQIWTHRLVDYCQLGEAINQACGRERGEFVEAFNGLRRESAEEAASGDPVIQHVLDVVRDLAAKGEQATNFPSWRRWGAAGHCAIKNDSGVHVAVKASFLREHVRVAALINNNRGWLPESDKAMSDVITQKKPTLAAIGISVRRECFNGDSGAAWVFSWAE
ncbi:MAG: hypothetical protein ACM3SV_03605 [Betaproteobacteria bacterium]